jgi:beta-N-acetylhexosaminidase
MRLRVVTVALSVTLLGLAADVVGPANSGSTLPTATAATAASCVDATLSHMSTAQRAGQLLLVGVDATDPASGAASLIGVRVGGIFLRGRVAGSERLRRALASVQRSAKSAGLLPLFVAADEEGGLVQTIRGGTLPPFPSALVQGSWSTSKLQLTTRSWGTELARLGVNLDLAPVADTVPASLGTGNPPIGRYQREYGYTPAAVGRAVSVVAKELRRDHVGPTVKHFPGLGRVLANTDTSSEAVDTVTTATDPYLDPFRRGMSAGALAVMVSSARYPKLDAKNPAMWSFTIVTKLLRDKLGWQGLVVSDDLGQAVAAQSRTPAQRAVSFVGAGGDLVLTVRPDQAVAMRDALVAQTKVSRGWRLRVDDAARHVIAAKIALGLVRCG